MLGLASHLRTGEAVDPARFGEWSASGDGGRFAAASSEGWYEANVAGGADQRHAREAADRTTAAYTATG